MKKYQICKWYKYANGTRELYSGEIQSNQGTPEMTAKCNSIGHKEQSTFATDYIPDTQTGEMLLNNYNDSVVAVGALLCDHSVLDDILTPNF